jgi:hypothetical protein
VRCDGLSSALLQSRPISARYYLVAILSFGLLSDCRVALCPLEQLGVEEVAMGGGCPRPISRRLSRPSAISRSAGFSAVTALRPVLWSAISPQSIRQPPHRSNLFNAVTFGFLLQPTLPNHANAQVLSFASSRSVFECHHFHALPALTRPPSWPTTPRHCTTPRRSTARRAYPLFPGASEYRDRPAACGLIPTAFGFGGVL